MSNPSPGFKQKAGGTSFQNDVCKHLCCLQSSGCTHPILATEVFRRRLARFAELVLGQLCGSPLSKGCGVAAALAVCNRILAPLSLFFLEVSQAVKGGTAQEIPPADELVNIIIHNIHAGGICKDLLEQDTHF